MLWWQKHYDSEKKAKVFCRTVPSKITIIFTFSGLSIIFGPRGISMGTANVVLSVNPLDHNKHYKSVPLQSVFTVHVATVSHDRYL